MHSEVLTVKTKKISFPFLKRTQHETEEYNKKLLNSSQVKNKFIYLLIQIPAESLGIM